MQAQTRHRLTPEEYLAIERSAEYRSEYYNGEMFAMAGASRWHTIITGNLVAAVHSQLRVKVPATGLYTYPDVVVTRDKEEYEDDEFDILLNPLAIFTVLSKSIAATGSRSIAGRSRCASMCSSRTIGCWSSSSCGRRMTPGFCGSSPIATAW